MRRHHLIELHEQRWFPSQWRKMFQEGLGRCLPLMGGYRNLAAPLSRFLHRTGASAVLDLCSGSAEPIVHLRESLGEPLAEPENLKVFISDLYPNLKEFKKAKERYPDAIEYFPQPVNALNPPAQAPRVRTILSALHHFRPDDVRAILRDAAENADGIAAFESTGRTWLNLVMTLPLPLMAAVVTVFMLRPFRLRHLIWGLLIPVIPLTALFDGIVSNLRTYTVQELEELTRSIDVPGFQWEVGTAAMPRTRLKATYLFGWRTAR